MSVIVPASSEQLADFLLKQAENEEFLLLRFNEHAEKVNNGLIYIHGFMNNARQKSMNNKVQQWMQTVQEVFYDAQDIFEECSMEMGVRHTSFPSETVKKKELKEEIAIKSEALKPETEKKHGKTGAVKNEETKKKKGKIGVVIKEESEKIKGKIGAVKDNIVDILKGKNKGKEMVDDKKSAETEIKKEKRVIDDKKSSVMEIMKGKGKIDDNKSAVMEIQKEKGMIEDEVYVSEAGVCRRFCSPQMVQRIEAVDNRLQAALETAKNLDLLHDSALTIGSNYRPRGSMGRAYIRLDDSPIVGLENMIEHIVNLINRPRMYIQIVGGKGMGKTLLMQHVFKKINHAFDLSIWVSCFGPFSIQNLQSVIAAKIHESIVKEDKNGSQNILLQIAEGSMSEENATAVIENHLRETRCLIVLDGFSPGHNFKNIGVTGSNFEWGSKLVYISRHYNTNIKGDILYNMEYLSGDDQWKLFCLHAFPDCHFDEVPKELEAVGHAIVEMCEGIPLAIKMTAASMAVVPKLPSVWEGKLPQLIDLPLHRLYEVITPLSDYLQFFYFFPKDEDVDWEYLIILCKAEGYLYELEDVLGHESLNSMVELRNDFRKDCIVELRQDFEKGFEKYYCRIYNFWSDFWIFKCKENNWVFDLFAKDSKGSFLIESSRCRRLSMPKMDINLIPKGMKCSSALRSLSLAGNPRIRSIPAGFLSAAKALRVVDLSGTSIASLPKSVGQLKLIKVLNISSTQIKELPRCIRGLGSLEFLDVSGCKHLHSLPEWISELDRLQHLSMVDGTIGFSYSQLPRRLQIMRGRNSRPLKVEDVEHLTNLQELQLLLQEDNRVLVNDGGLFAHIKQMKVLSLCTSQADYLVPSEKMMGLTKLRNLHMEGYMVPIWLEARFGVEDLRLSRCEYRPFPALQTMLNLKILEVDDNPSCTELPQAFGNSGAFPSLQWLKVSRFTLLTVLPRLKHGAMPKLEYMKVEKCKEVQKLPRGLKNLTSLKELSVIGSHKLVKTLVEGSDDTKQLIDFHQNVKIYVGTENVELLNSMGYVGRKVEGSRSPSSTTKINVGTEEETSPCVLFSKKEDEYFSKD